MRITIVKNDDFKTIGLHVETTNPGYFTPERVYSWGISESGYNFAKTIPGDHYEKEVFALVKAQKELEAAENLMHAVAKAISDGGLKDEKNEDGSYSIGSNEFYDGIIKNAKSKVERLMLALEEAITKGNKK